MHVILKGLVALLIFGIVSAIAEAICRHFGIDSFWGWLVGVAAGLAFFFSYPDRPRTVL